MTLLFAHETWFDHGAYPTDWGFAAETLTLALLAAAVLATVVVRVIARFWPGVDVPALGRLAPFMPSSRSRRSSRRRSSRSSSWRTTRSSTSPSSSDLA